jgi:hypothetical protein
MRAVKERVWRSKNSGDPQCRQKCRFEVGDDWWMCGWPLVTLTLLDGMNSNPVKGAPDARWHMRQWQIPLREGTPLAS